MTVGIRVALFGAAVITAGTAAAQGPSPGPLPGAVSGTGPAMPVPIVKDVTPPNLFRTVGHDAPPAGGHAPAAGGHAPAAGGHGTHEGGHGETCTTCPPGEHGDILPPPHVHHESGWVGRAEYLLLRPRRSGADIALADPTRDLTPSGVVEGLNYSLRSGVRAQLGYQFDGGWDVLGGYTYLRATSSRQLAAPAGGVLYPTDTRPGLVDEVLTAGADGSLQYHVYDIEVGKKLHGSEKASARVFGGGRFVSLRQALDRRFDGAQAAAANLRTQTNYDGFGPTLGGEGTITVYNGFHAFGRGSAGLLTGTARASTRETNNAGATVYSDFQSKERRVVPNVGFQIGGGWQYHRVSVRVGYEMTHYWNATETLRPTSDFAEGKIHRELGDLSLEGLFFQAGLTF